MELINEGKQSVAFSPAYSLTSKGGFLVDEDPRIGYPTDPEWFFMIFWGKDRLERIKSKCAQSNETQFKEITAI
jgi:hypothetical protein